MSRKRDSAHLALHPPRKHIKADSSLDAAGTVPTFSATRGDNAGRLNAEQWFADTDNNASRDVSFPDNDPPFYISRQSSSGGSSVCAVHSDGTSLKHPALGKPTAPTKALLARMESTRGNSEDFRSVIDDLTIQNKKLKKKLKKKLRQYERLHCSHLQDDKMFEVRIHGLAAHKRRELEATLRSFASSIEESSSNRPAIVPTPIETSVAGFGPITRLQKAAVGAIPKTESLSTLGKSSSASTSCSRHVDSAYASMSGQTGTSGLHPLGRVEHDSMVRASQAQQSVKSYLHDIPDTLVPRHSMAMSESSKSKLVVRRLEQIFTGRGAASRRHTQSYQQQELSHTAAQADRMKLEPQGRGRQSGGEGVREARIADNVDLRIDPSSEANNVPQQSRQSSNDRHTSTQDTRASRESSPGQRPTRPLDLDLDRAQIPEENIHYIRHLGLPSPMGNTNPDTDDGWVFLNLLASMAQLHTLNVTPDFVKNSVANVSSRFELSSDSTKVRWLGGIEGTRLSSDSDDSSDMERVKSTGTSSSTNERGPLPKLSSIDTIDRQEPNTALPVPAYELSTDQDSSTKRVPIVIPQAHNLVNFHYKPLFLHGASSEQGGASTLGTNSGASSDVRENATGMHSGINSGSHGLREAEVNLRKQNSENGPIIFYHKARFCTDLSGDPGACHVDETAYHRHSEALIGCLPEEADYEQDGYSIDLADAMEVDYEGIDAAGSVLNLDDLKSCISEYSSSASSAEPMPLEASGLGGIQPDDNFVVKVQVCHRDNRKSMSFVPYRITLQAPSRRYRSSVESILETKNSPRRHSFRLPVNSEIVSTDTIPLKPSTLPSPLRFRSPFSSPASDEEDEDGVGSNVPNPYNSKSQSSREERPANSFPESPSEEDTETSYATTLSGSDDDSSIDLLAHARELDPDAVAACEREFDINLLPAGSVAATAGQSSSELVRSIQTDSDMDSTSVDEDGFSRYGDSD